MHRAPIPRPMASRTTAAHRVVGRPIRPSSIPMTVGVGRFRQSDVYLDRELLGFTLGLRSRIVASALLGLVGVVLGIARLALLGWLLARVFAGTGLSGLALPIAAAATVIAARSLVEYARTMIDHHTAFRVQARLRRRLYDHLVSLGPAYLPHARTRP